MKSMLMSSQGLEATKKKSVKAFMKVILAHMTSSKFCDLMDIPTHLGLIKVLLEYFKGLLITM